MDIQGKTVLVLGGWGLVGSAICRKFMEEKPNRIIVTSLNRDEALEAVDALQKDFPRAGKNFFVPWWGNIFVRDELKDIAREEIIGSEKYRRFLGSLSGRSRRHALPKSREPRSKMNCSRQQSDCSARFTFLS
jgi:hypothetical protein